MPTDYTFTGQRKAAEIGLMYYVTRWYDSEIGHFMEADIIVPGAGNPLAWNRYAYVKYNPLKYTDPRGHWFSGDHYDPAGWETPEGKTAFTFAQKVKDNPIVLQVDLEAYVAKNQYDSYYTDTKGLGFYACGIVACDAGYDLTEQLADLALEYGFSPESGIQPSQLEELYKAVFGSENVNTSQNLTMAELYNVLASGKKVVVDIMVSADGSEIGIENSVAHFARVLGMNWASQTLYVANTLGGPIWTESFDIFQDAWNDPENRATKIPNGINPETVIYWAIIINQ